MHVGYNITITHKSALPGVVYQYPKLPFVPYTKYSVINLGQIIFKKCSKCTLRYRDHIGWKSSKIISRLVILGCMFALCRTQHHGSTPRMTPLNFGRNRGARWGRPTEKVDFGVKKLLVSLKCDKIAGYFCGIYFAWCQNQWPWMTLKVIMRSV